MSLSRDKRGRTVALLLALCVFTCAMILANHAASGHAPALARTLNDGQMDTPPVPNVVSPPHYTITDLGELPNNFNAQGYGLNNFGAAVGIQYINPGIPHGFRYKNGALTDLDPVREAYTINSPGQVAGTASGRAAIYNSDGSITSIPQLPGDESGFGVAYGINDSGHAVGYTKRPIINDDPTTYNRAFLYRNGSTIDLNFGQFSTAYAINNSDQVAGEVGHDSKALLWSNGVITDLGTFGADGGSARAINNMEQVAGFMRGHNPDNSIFVHAFLWTAGFKQDLGVTPGSNYSFGYGINEYGQVVGDLNTFDNGAHAFIYTNGQIFDLNNLIPSNSGWLLRTAYDINDTGQIVGTGRLDNGNGPVHAFLLTPAPAQPLVAGGKIVFSSNSEIWTINDDGTGRTQLTSNGRINSAPSWSPDTSRLAFQSAPAVTQNADIFAMSADGHDVKNLTNNAADDQQPVWSSDGNRIAFTSNRDGDYDIYLMNSDGTNLVNLTNNTVTDESPSWSPDGTKIVFDSTQSGSETDIFVMNADGSNQKRLTTDPAIDQFPSWSPDGKKLAFVSTRDGEGFQIWVMNSDGNNQTRLTSNSTQGKNLHPSWSPDGSRIAFISLGDNFSGEVYTMNPDGSQPARLTNDTATDLFPDWQKLNFPQPNVIDDPRVFVRQHYLDFLNREPDTDGLTYWTAQIAQCLNNAACIHNQRIGVSAAYFIENEFQQTGFYVEKLYRSALARRSSYSEFTADRAKITVGAQLESSKQAFAEEFVARSEFTGKYPTSQARDVFVDALIATVKQTSGVDLANRRDELIAEYNAGTNQTNQRARTLRKLIEYAEYVQAEYNPAFVLMQYFGYLKRDADTGGYNFWLDILNNRVPNNYRSMVCAFITSAEYQRRFGSVVTHSNSECRE
ncbi:MAG TPA: DUF4214 domain-containing protein [Pyrinomonadaceae bacterium]|nr:DUF4214 domain-containing protein [Pyrinomonadaceae bacterium]